MTTQQIKDKIDSMVSDLKRKENPLPFWSNEKLRLLGQIIKLEELKSFILETEINEKL